jgi:hypothetical protein
LAGKSDSAIQNPDGGTKALSFPACLLWPASGCVRRDTIRHWVSGRMRFGPDHPALVRLLEIADKRASEVAQARDELRAWLAERPPEESRP